MAQKKKRPQKTKKPEKPLPETLSEVLASALTRQDDVILTYELNTDEDTWKIHVMTGKLISPCMLGTLKNRVELQEKEGSAIITRDWR
jgi:hypothetical protein